MLCNGYGFFSCPRWQHCFIMEVRFSLVLKTASFLGGRTWHCDMNFGRNCAGTPWTVGYGGGRMLVYSMLEILFYTPFEEVTCSGVAAQRLEPRHSWASGVLFIGTDENLADFFTNEADEVREERARVASASCACCVNMCTMCQHVQPVDVCA